MRNNPNTREIRCNKGLCCNLWVVYDGRKDFILSKKNYSFHLFCILYDFEAYVCLLNFMMLMEMGLR
jgi:hypothetical protein